MKHAPWLMATLVLAACNSSSVLPWIQPPPMETGQGIASHAESQNTPELEARAVSEREDLPGVPAPPPDDNFYTLGTVPPRPAMPGIADIAGEANALDAEQKAAMDRIAVQAGMPPPETLPKPNAGGTPPAVAVTSTEGTLAPANPVMGGVQTMTMSGDNSSLLPQSQSLEATDFLPPDAR